MREIIGRANMTAQIQNKEQLREGRFTVRNAKPYWDEQSHILGRETHIFEENIDSKKN